MFAGFGEQRIALGAAEIFLRIGGAGPPLLLLHDRRDPDFYIRHLLDR